ncbi:MAG: universal stress protein [Actinobacteria bacterium]|nr:universal stress protein [Actinomycetota bacterium]
MSDNDFEAAPRRVLLGYDGSAGAADAIELCRTIAPQGAEVIAADVLPFPGAPSETFRLLTGSDFPLPADHFEPVLARLPGRRVDTLTYAGDSPARVFEEIVSEVAIDLIVVGSPHRGAIGRALHGSVAEALLHGSPVPVATAPRGYASRAHEGLRTIAVAYDGGAEARAALAYAEAIAGAAGGRLKVLTVARPTDPVGGAIAYTFSLPQDTDDIQRQALREVDPAIDLRRRVLHGETAAAIAGACADAVDLLVVGSRGYGTVERVLLGSTSAAPIHEAPCPVIVVPRPAAGGRRRRHARQASSIPQTTKGKVASSAS